MEKAQTSNIGIQNDSHILYDVLQKLTALLLFSGESFQTGRGFSQKDRCYFYSIAEVVELIRISQRGPNSVDCWRHYSGFDGFAIFFVLLFFQVVCRIIDISITKTLFFQCKRSSTPFTRLLFWQRLEQMLRK